MSDQRKIRADARQGFHQFAMHLYQSYLQGHKEEEAKQLVAESIKEQLRLFMDSDSSYGDVREIISQKMDELTPKRFSTNDYDEQMYWAEKLSVLEKAMEILAE
jgi:hypothetical protein